MFKVASVISHGGLKSELENQAISLSANPCPDTIFSAENLINLGRETGNIKPINAVVLIRELEALKKGLSVTPVVLEDPKDDLDISAKFAKSNSSTSAKDGSISDTSTKGKGQNHSSDKPVQVTSEETRTNDGVKQKRPGSGRKSSINPDKVYQYIAGHKESRLKELESEFSEVSGRTVRRMTEALIKEGKIERIGNPGPTSFYQVTSKQSSGAVISPDSQRESSSIEEKTSGKTPNFLENNSLGEDVPQLSYGARSELVEGDVIAL
jgi:hypothetical protein